MVRPSTRMNAELFATLERRIVGSLYNCPQRRLHCTSIDEVGAVLLNDKFKKKRDLPMNVREHMVFELERSAKIVVDYFSEELVTMRLPSRRDKGTSPSSKYVRPRERGDSRRRRS